VVVDALVGPVTRCVRGRVDAMVVDQGPLGPSATSCDATTTDDVVNNDNRINIDDDDNIDFVVNRCPDDVKCCRPP